MKVEITYPLRNKRKRQRQDIIEWAKWPFLFAAYFCPVLNIFLGGPAWSVIVVWSLWIIWSFTFSPDLVEINRISQFIKLIFDASILLFMIDILLSPGWALDVVPIVCFGGLIVAGVLFFTNLDAQKQNMMPILSLIACSFVFSVIELIFWSKENRWTPVVMGALALALLIAIFLKLGGGLIREIKKRFHIR